MPGEGEIGEASILPEKDSLDTSLEKGAEDGVKENEKFLSHEALDGLSDQEFLRYLRSFHEGYNALSFDDSEENYLLRKHIKEYLADLFPYLHSRMRRCILAQEDPQGENKTKLKEQFGNEVSDILFKVVPFVKTNFKRTLDVFYHLPCKINFCWCLVMVCLMQPIIVVKVDIAF